MKKSNKYSQVTVFSLVFVLITWTLIISPSSSDEYERVHNSNINQKLTVTIQPIVSRAKWYEGGTLQNKKIRDWDKALYTNKLATCAYFFTIMIAKTKADPTQFFLNNAKLLKEKAAALETCISKGTVDPKSKNINVSDMGSMCLSLMYK